LASKSFIRVARSRDAVYVGVVGHGNMNNSHTFRAFADRMAGAGYRSFIIDLCECRGMDSTFLGILLSITQNPSTGESVSVIVVNPGPHNLKILESVGLTQVIKVKPDYTTVPHLEFEVLEECHDPDLRLRTIREAHENLLRLDRRNEEQFGPFLRALTEELQ
jgi:anti-anti-sigma factor